MTPLSTICLETHRPSINVNILVHLDALPSWFFHLHISLPTSTFHLFFFLLTSLHLSSLESPTLHHQHLLGPYPLHSSLSIMTPSLVYSLPLFHFFGHVAPYDASTFWPLHISTKKKKRQKTKDQKRARSHSHPPTLAFQPTSWRLMFSTCPLLDTIIHFFNVSRRLSTSWTSILSASSLGGLAERNKQV